MKKIFYFFLTRPAKRLRLAEWRFERLRSRSKQTDNG